MKFEITIGNDIGELERVNALLEEAAVNWAIGREWLFKLSLAVEETVSNIILYGFDKMYDKPFIHIEIIHEGNQVRIVITDNGKAFNPLSIPPPDDLDKPAKERNIGGLGVYFIRNMMDEVAYLRDGDRNILTLYKSITK
ncbi:MAG: ATP-binding protein [Bacteroidales bacterium]|jgi:anti-sigma regulatory factor (Ser/Thr protein kinase)